MVVALLLLFLAALPHSGAQTSSSAFMQVYADGSASITQSLEVNSSSVSVVVPLLSSVITNVLATDQNGSPLSFQIQGNNVTVYTVGATGVNLHYDTDSLTSKQGSVWTLAFETRYNVTITLPAKSSLSSVTGTPTSISEQNGSPVVTVSPGNWTISYGVPIEAVSSTQTTNTSSFSSSSQTSHTNTTNTNNHPNSLFFDAGLIAAVVIVGSIGAFLLLRRRQADIQSSELRPDDVQVLNYISEKGGKVFEQEIRSRFTLPKTSTWRQLKRLERLGYLKIYKVGSQNQVELLKKREQS